MAWIVRFSRIYLIVEILNMFLLPWMNFVILYCHRWSWSWGARLILRPFGLSQRQVISPNRHMSIYIYNCLECSCCVVSSHPSLIAQYHWCECDVFTYFIALPSLPSINRMKELCSLCESQSLLSTPIVDIVCLSPRLFRSRPYRCAKQNQQIDCVHQMSKCNFQARQFANHIYTIAHCASECW